jgi:hypothetical protein
MYLCMVHHDAHGITMRYDTWMRTTIDLPDDLHRMLIAVAHDQGVTLSQTVAGLVRRTLSPGGSTQIDVDSRTGLPTVRLGRVVTQEDVRNLEDDG